MVNLVTHNQQRGRQSPNAIGIKACEAESLAPQRVQDDAGGQEAGNHKKDIYTDKPLAEWNLGHAVDTITGTRLCDRPDPIQWSVSAAKYSCSALPLRC
jgi:hypothetical protein